MLHPPSIQALAPRAVEEVEKRRWLPAALRGKPWRRLQREWCQRVYRYPHRNLLVISLPKSGSTWVRRMLEETPGYVPWNPPNIKWHCHDIDPRLLNPPPAGYTVTKTHTPPTDANIRAVESLARPYVLTIRDLRDVAVSWSFYALNRTHGWAYRSLAGRSPAETLDYFIAEVLPGYTQWSLGWWRRRHPERSLLVRYEDLLADTAGWMRRVFEHFELPVDDQRLLRIVEAHRFERVTGRARGQEDRASFNRKGVAGDWTNHFSPDQKRAFKETAGRALIELGYAQDMDW